MDINLQTKAEQCGNGVNHYNGNMTATTEDKGLNGSNSFKRTKSLPADRRKNRCQVQTNPGETIIPEVTRNNGNSAPVSQNGSLLRRNKKWLGSFQRRNEDVRVSTFFQDGFHINEEMKRRLQNGEHNRLLPNGNTSRNETDTITSRKTRTTQPVGLVRKLQDRVRRMGSISEKQVPSVTKVVEVVKVKDQSLGIFIKRRRVPRQLDNGVAKFGIFISRLDPASQAASQGLLQVGDQVLSINTVEVLDLDVKSVAAMMCMPQRLVLKVRRMLKNLNKNGLSQHHAPLHQNGNLKNGFQHMSALPEEDGTRTNSLPRFPIMYPAKKTATLDSVYDNPPVDLSSERTIQQPPSGNSERSSVLLKFDESLQILNDAIACCDKSKNENNNSSTLVMHQHKLPSSNELVKTEKLHNDTVEDAVTLLDQILSEMNSKQLYDSNDNVPSTSNSTQTTSTLPRASFEFKSDDPDYDEVPSDDESSSNGNEEVNLDKFEYSFKKSLRLSIPDCDLSIDKQSTVSSSPILGFTPFIATTQPLTPPFPVAHPDIASVQANNIADPTGTGVTVHKKRQWLEKGHQVSDEFRKRLEGPKYEAKYVEFKHSTSKNKDANEDHCDSSNQKWLSESGRRTSESSSHSSSNSSSSPSATRSLVGSLESPGVKNDVALTRKNSLKSPLEKSAKQILSVSTPTAGKTFFGSDKQHQGNDQNSGEFYKEHLQGNDNTCSMMNNSKDDCNPESLNHIKAGTNSGSSSTKITSPSRSRKRHWKQKFSKKFKKSSAENVMNDYTCWTVGEEEQQLNTSNTNPLIPATRPGVPVTRHNRSANVKRPDNSVLGRYHLDVAMDHQRRLSSHFLIGNTGHDPGLKPISLSQFKKYKHVPASNGRFLPSVEGCLVITIYGVRELKKTLCEAYCLVQVDNATTKRIGTSMQTCRGSVAWNQCFEMMVSKAHELHFTLYTWETRGGKHKIYSYATINLLSLIQGTQPNSTFSERLAVKLESKGTLYVKVALEKTPSNCGAMVFGADLQSIVDRESSGYSVPRLVHSCIEEVEKRGMKVVGIYRLCGSAIVKKELRRQVEEAKTELDLTDEKFPDVNVITGILKDFLRELPQPLFPPELLEAVSSTMERYPGPTPATVVKEPFAPNPTLTCPSTVPPESSTDPDQKTRTAALLEEIKYLSAAPAEGATLYALLNHLKKVAMHCGSNKMTCQNLAVCFGPVLLGPVNASLGTGIDLNAAIGFKRHIQVLNYMLSNWPDEPVPVPKAVIPLLSHLADDVSGESANRMSCVSLTRRLSRVVTEGESPCVEAEGVGKRGTLVSLGRSESLTSIVESADQFADPELDYCNIHHQRQQASELSTQSH